MILSVRTCESRMCRIIIVPGRLLSCPYPRAKGRSFPLARGIVRFASHFEGLSGRDGANERFCFSKVLGEFYQAQYVLFSEQWSLAVPSSPMGALIFFKMTAKKKKLSYQEKWMIWWIEYVAIPPIKIFMLISLL